MTYLPLKLWGLQLADSLYKINPTDPFLFHALYILQLKLFSQPDWIACFMAATNFQYRNLETLESGGTALQWPTVQRLGITPPGFDLALFKSPIEIKISF